MATRAKAKASGLPSAKAASEARSKGLTGERKRAYVGGAINRARHEKAQEQADHREAMADARQQIRYHEAQIAGLREGVKLRRAMAGEGKPKRRTTREQHDFIMNTELKPIRYVENPRSIGQEMAEGPDPAFLREVYGQDQLPHALDLFPTASLRTSAKKHGMSAGGSREALIARLAAPPTPRAAPVTRPLPQPKPKRAPRPKYTPPRQNSWLRQQADPTDPREALSRAGSYDALYEQLKDEPTGVLENMADRVPKHGRKPGRNDRAGWARYIVEGMQQPPKPKRAPRPKKPPDYEQMRQRQIAAAGGLVPKTPLDRLRKMPVREMSDPQLLRDWENHPPERRRGVLEREMARRHAKAEKAQQPKPAKRTQRRRS